jgi:hypothetical protein
MDTTLIYTSITDELFARIPSCADGTVQRKHSTDLESLALQSSHEIGQDSVATELCPSVLHQLLSSDDKHIVTDQKGNLVYRFKNVEGGECVVRCSLVISESDFFALSYRWVKEHNTITGTDDPKSFMTEINKANLWVDFLQHLYDEELEKRTLRIMGKIYAMKPVWAKYLLSENINLIQDCTRGWMWQELVFTPYVVTADHVASKVLIASFRIGLSAYCNGFYKALKLVRGAGSKYRAEPELRAVVNLLLAVHSCRQGRLVDLCEPAIAVNSYGPNSIIASFAEEKLKAEADALGGAFDNLSNTNFTKPEDAEVASLGVYRSLHGNLSMDEIVQEMLLRRQGGVIKVGEQLQIKGIETDISLCASFGVICWPTSFVCSPVPSENGCEYLRLTHLCSGSVRFHSSRQMSLRGTFTTSKNQSFVLKEADEESGSKPTTADLMSDRETLSVMVGEELWVQGRLSSDGVFRASDTGALNVVKCCISANGSIAACVGDACHMVGETDDCVYDYGWALAPFVTVCPCVQECMLCCHAPMVCCLQAPPKVMKCLCTGSEYLLAAIELCSVNSAQSCNHRASVSIRNILEYRRMEGQPEYTEVLGLPSQLDMSLGKERITRM